MKITKTGERREIPILEAETTSQDFHFSGHVPFGLVWDHKNPLESLLEHDILYTYIDLEK